MRTEPLFDDCGVIVTPDPDEGVWPVRQEFLNLLRDHGIVQVRGVAPSVDRFHLFCDSLTFGQRRGVWGTADLHFHGEGYYLPFWRIDVLWFYCLIAPALGGETKVVDGVRIAKELRPSTRKYFEENPLVYVNWLQRQAWMGLLEFMGYHPERIDSVEEAIEWFTMVGLECEADSPDIVKALYRVGAIRKTQFGGDDAFVNTMVHALIADQKVYKLVNEFPEDIVAEVREVTDRFTRLIPWQEGFFAAIDNTRFMHGRRAYEGPRKLVAVNGHFVEGWALPANRPARQRAYSARA